MAKPSFDPDVYELQLARILLDTLLKKDAIGLHTYKVTQRKLNEMEECSDEHSHTICSLDVDCGGFQPLTSETILILNSLFYATFEPSYFRR